MSAVGISWGFACFHDGLTRYARLPALVQLRGPLATGACAALADVHRCSISTKVAAARANKETSSSQAPVPQEPSRFRSGRPRGCARIWRRIRVMAVPLSVTGDRMARQADEVCALPVRRFSGARCKLGQDDRLLVKLLSSTMPQSEIRIVTGSLAR
jgi:hypothetical protein